MLSLEDHVRGDCVKQIRDEGAAGNDQVAHPRATVSQVPATYQGSEMLQALSGGRALREGDRCPDVETEPVLLLPDKLEVDTSITVQESCDVRRVQRSLVLAFPRYCPEIPFGWISGFHRYEPVSTQELLPGDAVIYVLNPARVPL